MPPFINNEDWFRRQSDETQTYIFSQFKDDFQAFLNWCEEPYKDSFKHSEPWQKQN